MRHHVIVEAEPSSDSHSTSQKVINKKDFFSSLIENERQKQVHYSLAHPLINSLTHGLTHSLTYRLGLYTLKDSKQLRRRKRNNSDGIVPNAVLITIDTIFNVPNAKR